MKKTTHKNIKVIGISTTIDKQQIQQHINWLNRYIEIWNRDHELHGERHYNMLCNIYTRYVYANITMLNETSVEDNLCMLIDYMNQLEYNAALLETTFRNQR